MGIEPKASTSNRLNGPTTAGMPSGRGNPYAARSISWRVAVARPTTSGSSAPSALQRAPAARPLASSESSTPRLLSSARLIASSTVSVIGSAVAVPLGTLPRNGAGGRRVETGGDGALVVGGGTYWARTVALAMTAVTKQTITSSRLTRNPPVGLVTS